MDPSSISEQIHRILHSQSFSNKAQLRKLLEVLHRNIDSQHNLNPDLVIRELWPSETRTKRAADVATEMNRLRHALDAYYQEEGKSDLMTIALPNRAAPGGNGTQEKVWIVAKPRGPEREPALLPQAGPGARPTAVMPERARRGWKIAAVIAAACAVSAAAYVTLRMLVLPDQPKIGRLEGSALVIMNADGKELWRKVFPAGFGPDWYYKEEFGSRMWFGDLESKGHTSVLFVYSPASSPGSPHSSTLICYSDRGKEKWRWTPGRELPELAGTPATYKTRGLAVLKPTKKQPLRIVVASQHDPWWPSQIALLDSNGKTISEYWHSGGLNSVVLADLDGDGREEIITTGVANGYDHQATLVVLDPDRVFGASSEVQPEFQIHGMGVAQERLRLLFPRSDLNRALFQFNAAVEPTVDHGMIRLTVLECMTPPGCRIWYQFNRNLKLIAAFAGGDEFRSTHERFFQSGKGAHALSSEEQAAFLKVRCLVGCKTEFVPVGKLVP